MNRMNVLTSLLVIALIVALISPFAWATDESAPAQPTTPAELTDTALPAYQVRLIEEAYKAATSYPVVPHIKNRSLAEEQVVQLCVELGQIKRAASYIPRIKDFRRGTSAADFAYYFAKQGDRANAQKYLELADTIRHAVDLEDWRIEKISVRMARAYMALGDNDMARKQINEHTFHYSGDAGLLSELLVQSNDQPYEKIIEVLDEQAKGDSFEHHKSALSGYAYLLVTHYKDETRRTYLLEQIKVVGQKLPNFYRYDAMVHAIEKLERLDKEAAGAMLDLILVSQSDMANIGIKGTCRLAEVKYRLGRADEALADMQTAAKMFDELVVKSVMWFRFLEGLPIAEAYARMEMVDKAMVQYQRLLELSMGNLNRRPITATLVGICLSAAKVGIEPSAAMWEQINAAQTAIAGLE